MDKLVGHVKQLAAGALGVVVIALALVFSFTGTNGQTKTTAESGVTADRPAATATTSSSEQTGSSQTTAVDNASSDAAQQAETESPSGLTVTEDGTYTSKDEVALYIHTFGHLPSNFISKTKAKRQGWRPTEGNLDEVCPGKSIGGGPFYDDEDRLPDAEGRTWKECDIDYDGGARGPKRIVYSNDGLIYYTDDHYRTFERLY